MSEQANCAGRNRDGRPCAARPLPGSNWCPFHDPARAEARREWSRQGGASRSNAARARKQLPEDVTAADLRAILSGVLVQTIAGTLPPGVATASATVARAWVAVNESDELERRITALEDSAEQRRGA